MNKEIVKTVFPEFVSLVDNGKCPFCEKFVLQEDFKDELSRKEFSISGLCQKCQDGFFDPKNDD